MASQSTLKAGPSRSAAQAKPLQATANGVSKGVSIHLGFDKSKVMTIANMQTWWNTSQYWDTAVYLLNSPNRSNDSRMTATWIAAIQAQGWGVWPIWFGSQPSTACAPPPKGQPAGTPGNCTTYFTTQIDPANAFTQGEDEATNAMAQAEALGICCAVIYKNIENYVTETDGAAVQAFLSGWTTILQQAGYTTAAYGNLSPVVTNFTQASPPLDEVWVARSNHESSTWGLLSKLGGYKDANLWTDHQRIHQYWIDHAETHGGVSASIDSDIEDATILGNSGVKPYTWTWTEVPSPYLPADGGYLAFEDINDSDQIVGNYQPTSATNTSGLLYADGNITDINDPTVTNPTTYIYTVNNITTKAYPTSDIVGDTWEFSGGADNYWEDHHNTFEAITTPAGYQGFSWWLNDAGQMSGCTYDEASQMTNGFLYQGGDYSFLVYGAYPTCAYGLNGQGQIVGTYQTSDGYYHGFIYSLADGWATLDYPNAVDTYLLKINSNGAILGEALTPGLVFFLYVDGQFAILSLPYFNDNDIAQSLNDFADIVGYGETFIPQQTANVEGVYGQTQH